MAELNFGLLTPPGSQNIGNAFVQGMDQAAVARAQENQNALSQYTLGKARREDELTNRMLAGLQGATTIEEQAAVLRSVGKVSEANALVTSGLTQQELRGRILAQPADRERTELTNRAAKATFFATRLPILSQNPDDAGVGRFLKEAVAAGVMSFEEASAKSADLLSKPLPERRLQMLQGGQNAKDALAQLRPDIKEFSGGLYNVNKFDPATGMPQLLSPRVAPPSTQWNPETLQFQTVGGASGAAPAPAAPPRITPQVPTERNAQQIVAPGGDPLRPAPVVNNMPGAPAPVVNAMTAPPPAVAPTAYSPKMLRDMALKGMQPDGKGGQTFIPGGEKDPAAIVRLEAAKAEGAATGKDMVAAVRTLPNAITSSQKALANIDAMLGDARVEEGRIKFSKGKEPHPGFRNAVGAGIGLRFIPGTDASDFQERFREITSGAFLEAFEALRGGGSITEKEGEKATAAKTRMSLAQSEKEFVTAAREYQDIIRVGVGRAQERLNKARGASAGNTGGGASGSWGKAVAE